MNIHAALLAIGLISTPCVAVLHPVLIDPRISSCSGSACNDQVWYTASGLNLVDTTPLSRPDPAGGLELAAVGLHCATGTNLPPARPFGGCLFIIDGIHNPNLSSSCKLKSTDSWELANPSRCYLTNTRWGGHWGAGPGGECVLFTQKITSKVYSLMSIYGFVSADDVANSGNRFCQKPLPPDVTCDIALPSVIDHGIVQTNDQSSITVEGDVSCGANPVVSILGGGKFQLAPGVTTELSSQFIWSNKIRLTSNLRSINGTPGTHQASVVVIVSPY